jgi:ethanolamine utilization protein EutN
MILANVVGTVVANKRADDTPDARYLLVEACNQKAEGKQDYYVALDMVSANRGELVLVTQGSPSRQTDYTFDHPFDAVIVGIVDLIDQGGEVSYRK